MVLKAGIEDPGLLGIPGSLLPELREQAELFSREDLLRLFDAFQKIETSMKYSTQVRFQLEMGLIELSQIAKLRSLEDLIAEFSDAEENPQNATGGLAPSRPASPAPVSPAPRPAALRPQPTPDSAEKSILEDPPAAIPAPGSKDLLLKIAGAIGRASLETILQDLEGARLQGDRIVLEMGAAKEFVRNQIKENLPLIIETARRVVGRQVSVQIGDSAASEPPRQPSHDSVENKAVDPDMLEKAKREPIVKSFLDVFPGRVKADKIDS
jgi:DNA polymerase III gamma/tau subunit